MFLAPAEGPAELRVEDAPLPRAEDAPPVRWTWKDAETETPAPSAPVVNDPKPEEDAMVERKRGELKDADPGSPLHEARSCRPGSARSWTASRATRSAR